MDGINGANELTIKEIEAFLNDEGTATPAVIEEQTPPVVVDTEETITKVVAKRLREETEKVRTSERENLAKQLGFETYDAFLADRQAKMLKDKGLDPDEVAPVVDKIVQEKLAALPELKELEELRQKKVEEWALKELVELKTLTGGKLSKMEDVPADVLELWKKKGSLKSAYLELHGEKLIKEMQNGIAGGQSKGSTDHLKSPQGTPGAIGENKGRAYTDEEKRIYKIFNPNVTDEQLNKLIKKE